MTEPFSADDPRLSAYLLGELEAGEQADFERDLQSHPEASAVLEDLRLTLTTLTEALEGEPSPALTPGQRSTILAAASQTLPQPKSEIPAMKTPARRGTWVIGVALSALAVVLTVMLLPPGQSTEEAATLPMEVAEKSPAAIEADYGYLGDGKSNRGKDVYETFSPPPANNAEKPGGKYFAQAEEQPLPSVSESTPPRADSVANKPQPRESGAGRVGANFRPRERDESKQNFERSNGLAQLGTDPQDAAKKEPGTTDLTVSREKLAEPKPTLKLQLGERVGDLAERGTPSSALQTSATPGNPSQPATPGQSVALAPNAPMIRNPQPEGKTALSGQAIRPAGLEGREDKLAADFGDEAAPGWGNESYQPIIENEFIVPRGEQALSTFSIDVDTASYSNVRRFLKHGQRPPIDAVRIEELLNYFHYDYAPPTNGDPFAVHTEVAACPWNADHRLVRFGLKGREISKDQRPLSNLVFLVDVSGSMSAANKLPLVKNALTMLTNQMNENDRIAIVTYAGQAGVRLPSTSGEHRSDILTAIHGLNAGGSTNGEAGLHLAYTEAIRHFIEDGSNRVILCSDGDFNVGVSGDDELATMIQDKAKKSSVFLSIFGFGMGNYKDAKLEKLADKGNGHYGYVDNEREARKLFVEELTGTLYTIAKDVKIQVEFNPALVGAYRLIGYENRVLAAQDFNDDAKDAGEIGAGHTVTALYEIIPAGQMPAVAEDVDRLKYQPPVPEKNAKPSPEMLTLKLRYKQPDEDVSVKREYPVTDNGPRGAQPSAELEWQAAVTGFGMVLRNSKHKGQADLRLVRELAFGSRGPDPSGRRREFIDLIYTAERLAGGQQAVAPPKEVPAAEAEKMAAVRGKYQKLLKTIAVPQDAATYGAFNDYGYWEGTSYAGQDDLPKAHWVYVAPNWYLWGETANNAQPVEKPE